MDFAPSTTALFQFLATLANGVQYNVQVPQNAFGERWYVTVADLSGNVVAHRPVTQSGPMFNATLTWADQVATAVLNGNHNVPLAGVINARVSQSNTAFDGSYQMLAVNPSTFTFALPANPDQSTPVAAKVDFPLDLLGGLGIGSLYFHADTQQFEF